MSRFAFRAMVILLIILLFGFIALMVAIKVSVDTESLSKAPATGFYTIPAVATVLSQTQTAHAEFLRSGYTSSATGTER